MVDRKRKRNPPWSDLPQELLSSIANYSTSNTNYMTFRSVCRSWRSSCPRLSGSSLLSRNSYYRLFDYDDGCCFLSVTTICAFYRPLKASSIEFSSLLPDACVLFLDEYTPGKLSIRKPFSTKSYNKPINFPNNINLYDFNVRELGRFRNLSYNTPFNRCEPCEPRYKDGIVTVIMFPNDPAAINLNGDGTLGMYRFYLGIDKEYILPLKPETKHDGKGFRFDDIIEFKGRVLGVDRRGRVYEIKYHSSEMTSFIPPIAGGGGRRKRLVESVGLLYLVVRCKFDPREDYKRAEFKVYELNERRKRWVEITSLGDRSFSFGRNFSFSASARELGPSVKNCILFSSHSFPSYYWRDDYPIPCSKLDIGVYHFRDVEPSGAIELYSGYSDSLWPPPSWIWPIDRMKRIGIVATAFDEMLNRIPEHMMVVRPRFCHNRSVQLLVQEQVKRIPNLKKAAIDFQEEETEFMTKLRESISILNKMGARTESHGSDGTTEERLGCLDKLDNFKTSEPHRDQVLSSAISMLRKRDALLFNIEEQATEVEVSLTSLLKLKIRLHFPWLL